MQCPGCSDTLTTMDTDAGTTLDFCPGCGGVWFDRGEVKAYLAVSLPPLGEQAPTSQRGCPRCEGVSLLEQTFPGGGPNIERCPDCQGAWLDPGEVTGLKAILKKAGSALGFTSVEAPKESITVRGFEVPILRSTAPPPGMAISWRWVGLSVVTLLGLLGLTALSVNAWIASDAYLDTAQHADPAVLITGSAALAYALGGLLVGWRSEGFTLWEPAIVAVLTVMAFPVLFSTHFTTGQLLAAMLGAMVLTLLGAVAGERIQEH